MALIVVVLLNINTARQITALVYLFFVPGILAVKILRVNLSSKVSIALLSLGLSLFIEMCIGFIANQALPLFGVSKPLATLPLLVSISGVVLCLWLVIQFREKTGGICPQLKDVNPDDVIRGMALICIPLLAIMGATFDNRWANLLMALTICAIIILAFFSKSVISTKLYPYLIYIVAVSLLFNRILITRYLLGWDVYTEFYLFNLVRTAGAWLPALQNVPVATGSYNAMLSVTVLPAMYAALLNVPGEWIFNIFYSLLLAAVPVTLYQAYEGRFGKPTALLSAFYFVLFPRFYLESARRQWIGELFFALVILLLLERDMEPRKRATLTIMFGLALVVSHYSLSYFYLFCVAFAWLCMLAMSNRKKVLRGSFVLLMAVFILSWYTFISIDPTSALLLYGKRLFDGISHELLLPESRGFIFSSFSLAGYTLLEQIDRVASKVLYLIVLIGGAKFLMMERKSARGELEYAFMVIAALVVVASAIVLPYFAVGFVEDRLYHVTTLLLSPLAVLGGVTLLRFLHRALRVSSRHFVPKRNIYLRVLCVFFVVIFLFKIGFIYDVAGAVLPVSSISFSGDRMKTSDNEVVRIFFYNEYWTDADVFGALWLSQNTKGNVIVYADYNSLYNGLRAYDNLVYNPHDMLQYRLGNDTRIEPGAYIYLRSLNTYGILMSGDSVQQRDYSHFQPSVLSEDNNRIYSNGESEVFQSLDTRGPTTPNTPAVGSAQDPVSTQVLCSTPLHSDCSRERVSSTGTIFATREALSPVWRKDFRASVIESEMIPNVSERSASANG